MPADKRLRDLVRLRLLTRRTQGNTKADAAVAAAAARRVAPVAARRPTIPGVEAPTAATGHAATGPMRAPSGRSRCHRDNRSTDPDTTPKRSRACRTNPKDLVACRLLDGAFRQSWNRTTRSCLVPIHHRQKLYIVVVPARHAYSHSASVGKRYSRRSCLFFGTDRELATELHRIVPTYLLHWVVGAIGNSLGFVPITFSYCPCVTSYTPR